MSSGMSASVAGAIMHSAEAPRTPVLSGEAHDRAKDALTKLAAVDVEFLALEYRCAVEQYGVAGAALHMHVLALRLADAAQRDHRDPWADFTANLGGRA